MTERKVSKFHSANASTLAVSSSPQRYLTVFALACLLVLAAGISYSNTFDVPFVFDDFLRITDNPRIRTLWPLSIPAADSTRPFGMVTFAVNYAVHGNRVWGYHATNLAIHMLAGLTLFGIVRRTLLRGSLQVNFSKSATPLAFAISLIWLVHPLNTQAVTYIVQRLESSMALCYLATLYCFIRAQDSPRQISWYTLSVVCCAMGMGIKEVMVTAPVIVLWYDRAFVSSTWPGLVRNHGRYYLALIATWSILAWCMLRASIEYTAGNAVFVKGVTPGSYLLSQAGVIAWYLRLSIWPFGQCFDYGWPVAQTSQQIVPPLLLIGGLAIATVWAIFRQPALGFLGGWFFVILGPTSSVVPIIDLAVEQRMYLPLAAVVAVLVFAAHLAIVRLAHVRSISLRRLRFAGACLLAVLALSLATLTWGRNEVYRNPVGLYEDTARKAPHNARAYNNIGCLLHQQGELESAFAYLQRALAIAPGYSDAHTNIGVMLMKRGQLQAAVEHHQKAIALDPANARAHSGLGVTLLKQGLRDEGWARLHTAVKLNPLNAVAQWNFAKALAESGHPNEAFEHYAQALHIRPDDPLILYDFAVCLADAGRLDEAIEQYRLAVHFKPDYSEAHHNLGVVLTTRGYFSEAISHFRQAIALDPKLAVSHLGLGDALVAGGQLDEAITEYEKALAIQPNFQLAADRIKRLTKKTTQ